MVSYAKYRKIFSTTSTNGHFLTKENAIKTIESGLDRLIISLDGLDQLTYEKYRVGGNFEKVKQGIQNLVIAKKETGNNHPFIVIQFIVFKTNEHQLEEAKKLKKKWGVDKVEIKTAQVYSVQDKNQLIPENKKHRRYHQNEKNEWIIKHDIPNKCNRMWRAAVVSWDAQVVPCCFDKDADFQMGNLLENSFEEIKNSEKYTHFRNQVFTNRKQIDICRNCTEGL